MKAVFIIFSFPSLGLAWLSLNTQYLQCDFTFSGTSLFFHSQFCCAITNKKTCLQGKYKQRTDYCHFNKEVKLTLQRSVRHALQWSSCYQFQYTAKVKRKGEITTKCPNQSLNPLLKVCRAPLLETALFSLRKFSKHESVEEKINENITLGQGAS